MNKNTIIATLISQVFLSSAFAQGLSGGSVTTPIPVNARVAQACTIATSLGLNFATYDPVSINATVALNSVGQISIACTKGSTSVLVGLDYGKKNTGGQRAMVGTTSAGLLLYNVFQPSTNVPGAPCTFPASTAWGPSTGTTLPIPVAANSLVQLYNICGTIPGGQSVAADAYTDTITATIYF
jgi:spore coat protein U-like protein